MTTNYYALTCNNTNSEEEFFKSISTLLLKYYKPNTTKNKTTTSSISINVSIPLIENNKHLFAYNEFNNWFKKANFKYTFYKSSSYSPTTLYIDNISITDYHIDNDISKATNTINKIQYSFHLLELIIKPFLYLGTHLFYNQIPKAYISMKFILREPIPDIPYNDDTN